MQGMIQKLKNDRTHNKVPSDFLDVDEFESMSGARKEESVFSKGDRVHIFGLKNARQYNGQVGTAVKEEQDSKWLVQLDDGNEIMVKEKNLSLPVFNANDSSRHHHPSRHHETEASRSQPRQGPSSRFLNQKDEGRNTPKEELPSSRIPGCSNFDASTGRNVPISFRDQERGRDDFDVAFKRDALPEEVKMKFPVSSRAVVVGLKTATEINGRTASIIGYDDDRVIVKVETPSEFGSASQSKIIKVRHSPSRFKALVSTHHPPQVRPKHLQALADFFYDGSEDEARASLRTRSSDRR